MQLVCNGYYSSRGCPMSHGRAGGAYRWVRVQDVLDAIDGLDGDLFFQSSGSCSVHGVSILRLCVPVSPRGCARPASSCAPRPAP